MKVDTIIIGFGKCGKTIAPYLYKKGETVVLVEESPEMYGGTCINVGCIPTKSLLKSSELSLRLVQGIPDPAFYYRRGVEEKDRVVSQLRKANFEKLVLNTSVNLLNGKAHFIDKKKIIIKNNEGIEQEYEADKIIVDVGSRSVTPVIEGLYSDKPNPYIYYSNTIMNEKKLPKKLIIIGGGYIGLEYANIYSNFGSQVVVLSNEKRFMVREDVEVSSMIYEDLESQGIRYNVGVQINSVHDNVVNYTDKTGKEVTIVGDAILLATGRRPNFDGLNLAATGVKFNEFGNVEVNEYLESSVPGLYFVGDCNGGPQFTYISLDDSRILKSHFSGENTYTLKNRKKFPYTVFLSPALSRIGLLEKEATRQGYEVLVARLSVNSIPKARIIGNTRGFLKVVIDKKTNLILGASLYCELSYEMINLIKMAMDNNIPYTYLRDNIYTHPTMTEAFNDLFSNVK
jgi:pyruvate/2-oxoglutarate dehydrogenase complex dihydrolipoamide dehydrogenase (E3) component